MADARRPGRRFRQRLRDRQRQHGEKQQRADQRRRRVGEPVHHACAKLRRALAPRPDGFTRRLRERSTARAERTPRPAGPAKPAPIEPTLLIADGSTELSGRSEVGGQSTRYGTPEQERAEAEREQRSRVDQVDEEALPSVDSPARQQCREPEGMPRPSTHEGGEPEPGGGCAVQSPVPIAWQSTRPAPRPARRRGR